MAIADKLQKSLHERWCLRVRTLHPDRESVDGVVVRLTPSLVILDELGDFEFDGFVVLPLRFVAGVRDGRVEACWNAVIRENGALRACRSPEWLESCDTVVDVIAALRRRDLWPMVEAIAKSRRRTECWVGPIVSMGDRHFQIHGYDSIGEWETPTTLRYGSVYRIAVGSRYCEQFNAYMRKRPPSD